MDSEGYLKIAAILSGILILFGIIYMALNLFSGETNYFMLGVQIFGTVLMILCIIGIISRKKFAYYVSAVYFLLIILNTIQGTFLKEDLAGSTATLMETLSTNIGVAIFSAVFVSVLMFGPSILLFFLLYKGRSALK